MRGFCSTSTRIDTGTPHMLVIAPPSHFPTTLGNLHRCLHRCLKDTNAATNARPQPGLLQSKGRTFPTPPSHGSAQRTQHNTTQRALNAVAIRRCLHLSACYRRPRSRRLGPLSPRLFLLSVPLRRSASQASHPIRRPYLL